MDHGSPADPWWTEADSEESAPGRSALDGILDELLARWSEKPDPAPGSGAEEGGER